MYSEALNFGDARAGTEGSAFERQSAECLLAEDSPVARTHLYLRLLYSRRWADMVRKQLDLENTPIAFRTRQLLSSLDWQGLQTEQQARQRNLFAQLLRRSPSLMAVFGEHRLRKMLASFTDMPQFWRSTGRTLLENFALVMHPGLREQGAIFEADTLVLSGMISGIHSDSDLPSPWTVLERDGGGPLEMEGYERAESILTSYRLLDDDGRVPDASNLTLVRLLEPRRIFVVRLPGREVAVFAVPL